MIGYLIFVFLITERTFAYLDPGSGSLLIYIVSTVVLGIVFRLGIYVSRLLGLMYKKNKYDMILHIEYGNYESIFIPVWEYFSKKNYSILVITQYESSYFNKSNTPNLLVLKKDLLSYSRLLYVNADVFISSTTQLQIMMFKKSKHVKKYIHIVHSSNDISPYQPFAFDYYDVVIVHSDYMKESIRELEKSRFKESKDIYVEGLLYYDSFKEKMEPLNDEYKDRPTVLLAPSWGTNSMLNNGIDFLETVPKDKYNFIIRLHPQYKIDRKKDYEKIINIVAKNNWTFSDANVEPLHLIMGKIDILISDFSGIVYDFAFLTKKPIIACSDGFNKEPFEAHWIKGSTFTERFIEENKTFIKKIGFKNLNDLDGIINEQLKVEEHEPLGKKYIANFTNALPSVANRIEKILGDLK